MSANNNKLNVVLYWHMHQPDYRDLLTGTFTLPWTYLHTIKDYADMAMHLEDNPHARVVVNFTPILLEQIDDYAQQLISFQKNKSALSDPLLAALASDDLTHDFGKRVELINSCVKINKERVIHRYPAYDRLIQLNDKLNVDPNIIHYLSDQFVFDLLVWYHLSWLAEHTRRTDIRVKKLLLKEHTFDFDDRMELINVIAELVISVIPRYKHLAETKQIELSTTPYAHPITPLLLDLNCARQAMPDAPMPKDDLYPGGEQRAKWHIEKGLEVFKRHFGFHPKGCWPSEGAVSTESTQLLQDYGFTWYASGAGVFWNSVNKAEQSKSNNEVFYEHLPNQIAGQTSTCFFRDDQLSDLIGFEYLTWHADDAVANLVSKLEDFSKQKVRHENSVVSIIMDGENAWEHYPENGFHFLSALYERLSSNDGIDLITYSDYLDKNHLPAQQLPELVAGSWVYGTLSTWIGSEEKNRGWEMLCEAKKQYDQVMDSSEIDQQRRELITEQLALCEGSDWFWWFGDYNSAETVCEFEKLYRHNLTNLYMLMNLEPPEYLLVSFTQGRGAPTGGGSMRRSAE
jgi:alpha-amylase/alpha-mannosidase (GH57 family)